MSEIRDAATQHAPWHLWVTGIVALLWSSMGALDYVMTQTRNEDYMSAFTPEQLEFFYSLPAWVDAFWAIGVWGGVVGALLLLLRRRYAVWFFGASLLGVVVTTFQNYVLDDGLAVMGDTFSLVFTGVVFLVALGLFLYAHAMQARNVLG